VLEEKRKNLAADVDFEIEKADLKKQKRQELKANQEKIDKDLSKEELNKSKEILKEKLGNTKLFGKFLGIGGVLYGTQFIKEDFTTAQAANIAAQEGGDDSFESRMRKGASDLLGPNVAAGIEAGAKFLDPGIQMAADLGPEAVKGTFGTTDVADATLTGDPNRPFKTKEMINADQQIMQDKADQQQYRQQVSPQVDDELAIQKQMNLKKQSEGFGREAERKSQLSLDQQINELLAQRR